MLTSLARSTFADELNEPLLRAPALSNPNPDELPPATKLMMVLEAEQELRQLERELREIDALDSRGVVGAGELEGEPLTDYQMINSTKAVADVHVLPPQCTPRLSPSWASCRRLLRHSPLATATWTTRLTHYWAGTTITYVQLVSITSKPDVHVC
jgi:hypothetical protein